jgi:ribosomal protein S6--L-glutamate ligase
VRFCFIVEKGYLHDEMPLAAVEPLERRGHRADVLTPQARVTSLSELGQNGSAYDAYVLKTASQGPGLTILEAAGASGIPTINHWRSISLVRDKAVAVARARAHGLPVPQTYFVSTLSLLGQIGPEHFPLVIKPNHGSAGRAIRRLDHFKQLLDLDLDEQEARHFVAQAYVPNDGFDVKLYNTGRDIFAIRWPSPLHPEVDVTPGLLPMTPELKAIAIAFGRVFGLRIYGVDVLRSRNGWVAVDVNDFPSFHHVPDASERVAASVIRMAELAARRRDASDPRAASQPGPVSEPDRWPNSDDRQGGRPPEPDGGGYCISA